MSNDRFGFCEWYMPVMGASAVAFTAQSGYGGLQLCDKGGAQHAFPMNDAFIQKQYIDAALKYQISLLCINLLSTIYTGGAAASAGSEKGKHFILSVKKAAEACKKLKIPMLFIPGCLENAVTGSAEMKNCAEMLREAGKVCMDAGIVLAYESFMDSTRTMELYLDSGSAFSLIYDTLNPLRYGFSDVEEDLRIYPAGLLHTVHVKDGLLQGQHDTPLGSGDGKVGSAAETLQKRGYSGWVVNENNYWSGGGFDDRPALRCAAADLETMEKLFCRE